MSRVPLNAEHAVVTAAATATAAAATVVDAAAAAATAALAVVEVVGDADMQPSQLTIVQHHGTA